MTPGKRCLHRRTQTRYHRMSQPCAAGWPRRRQRHRVEPRGGLLSQSCYASQRRPRLPLAPPYTTPSRGAPAGTSTARPEVVRAKISGWPRSKERKARTPGKQGHVGDLIGQSHQPVSSQLLYPLGLHVLIQRPPLARQAKGTPPTPSSRCSPLAPLSITRAASTPRRTTRSKRCSHPGHHLRCAQLGGNRAVGRGPKGVAVAISPAAPRYPVA
jgi:hypothetical protein